MLGDIYFRLILFIKEFSMSAKCPFSHLTSTPLTMGNGAPVADNQNSLTAGPRGSLLSQV